ncbi:MAG: type 4a pilus biogenesis protein PilO [Candidatus Omnitrophica bacterium]|nr:type 4a pilus biogenesis protein PilO [Candidatus Omnitrophota bacterium]
MKTLFSRFTKRERLFFIITLCIILGVLAYIFVLEPVYKKWNQLRLEAESARIRLFKDIKLLASKESLEKAYGRYKDYIQKEENTGQEIASVLREIETTALNCGVKITSIKPKGEKQLKNYRKFTIELISEAKINQFLKFIYDLESSKKLLKVERLVLSLKGAQSDLLKGTLIIRKISF